MSDRPQPNTDIEREYAARGYARVAGADEAGRGPLCGPVCAAAVLLGEGFEGRGINDSKKLSEKRRTELYDYITQNATAWGVGFASPREIDRLNILNATMLAVNRAVADMGVPDLLLMDGNCVRGIACPALPVIKGDSKSLSIAAASILAKVSRDRLMTELDSRYPQYLLAKHKGYPTPEHMALVRTYGANGIYRMSFLKNIL